ncbi:Plug domain-containing protein, partial [bacterium]|nr:Plug domain-containing protein [bacterium]
MKKFLRMTLVFGCLVLIIFTGLSAQETEEKKSTSEVVLIKEDFIKNNCESVGDALQTITGVYVNSTGEISLRDVSSSKVVVVLDGQRLNTAQGGGVNVSDMPIGNIEKIELLRGGRSAQYG